MMEESQNTAFIVLRTCLEFQRQHLYKLGILLFLRYQKVILTFTIKQRHFHYQNK